MLYWREVQLDQVRQRHPKLQTSRIDDYSTIATGVATGGIVGANALPVLGFGAAGVKAGKAPFTLYKIAF